MSSCVCVTHLVEHMVTECKRFFAGTRYSQNWMFYHDALSLMTAKDTVAWMKAKGYYERWILPENGLHTDDPDLKAYLHRPVGDSPELMPWDTNLNSDVKNSVQMHIDLTRKLDDVFSGNSCGGFRGN